MGAETSPGLDWLPEAFSFGLEELVLGQAPREAQEAGVGHHPVRRPHAPSTDRPASLQQLVGLEHAEPPDLTETVEEALDLADVRAVGEHDPARADSGPSRPGRLP